MTDDELVKWLREAGRENRPVTGLEICDEAADRLEAYKAALEWALDEAGTEHPHYPERDEFGGWYHPYLANGSPTGGGVGSAHYGTALEAVISARTLIKQDGNPSQEGQVK